MQISGTQDAAVAMAAIPSPSQPAGPALRRDKLTPEQKKQVEALKKRDAEVRRHEQAHKAVAGPYALGGPKFKYVTGPDGKRYAVEGEVQVDTSKVPNDPEATIRKAQIVKRAALAPEHPSAQDRRVAAEASRMELEARRELAKQRQEDASALYDRSGQAVGGRSEPGALDLFA